MTKGGGRSKNMHSCVMSFMNDPVIIVLDGSQFDYLELRLFINPLNLAKRPLTWYNKYNNVSSALMLMVEFCII